MVTHIVVSGPVEDDWQLISAASGSNIPSTSLHQGAARTPQHQQNSRSASPQHHQHHSPVKGPCEAQDFPELASLSNEELAALLVDDTKYSSLVDSIMTRSSVSQVER